MVLEFCVYKFVICAVSPPEEKLVLLLSEGVNGANELMNHLLTIY